MFTLPLEIFAYYALPMIIVAMGLPANIISLIVFRNKERMEKIGPLFMYRLMFSIDTAFLLSIFVLFLGKGFELSLYLVSDLSCKLYFYFSYAAFTFSPLILVYISFDRFFSIKYYAHRLLFKNTKYSFIFFLLLFSTFCITCQSFLIINCLEIQKQKKQLY